MANARERVKAYIVLLGRLKAGEQVDREMLEEMGPIKTIAGSVSDSMAESINHAVMNHEWDRAIAVCQELLRHPLDG